MADCTAPIGHRCTMHWTAEDTAVSGALYAGDWNCRHARSVSAWDSRLEFRERSLGAEAAEQGTDIRDVARVASYLRRG